MNNDNCPLCSDHDPSHVLWRNPELRVIDVADPAFPGFTRVVWGEHVPEMTLLEPAQRRHIMDVVWVVEQTLRQALTPHKINLAQLGNAVPHVHWHIIPRWREDSRFPSPIWAAPAARTPEQQRAWDEQRNTLSTLVPAYHEMLQEALQSM